MKKLLILLLFALLSCGAKSLNKSTDKSDSTVIGKEISTELESNKLKLIEKNEKINEKEKLIQNDIETGETYIDPIDSNKPLVITDHNGKTTKVENGRLTNKKTIDKSIISETEYIKEIASKDLEIDYLKYQLSQKDSEIHLLKEKKEVVKKKEQFNYSLFFLQFWWLWLIIIIVAIILYKYYKGKLNFLPILNRWRRGIK